METMHAVYTPSCSSIVACFIGYFVLLFLTNVCLCVGKVYLVLSYVMVQFMCHTRLVRLSIIIFQYGINICTSACLELSFRSKYM